MKGLFLNSESAICSINESGKMIFNALRQSIEHTFDYQEISEKKNVVPGGYDFYIFNYHFVTTSWIKTKLLKELPGTKICVVLEVSPDNPFVLTPKDDFDAYMVIDPTVKREGNVFPFPRPLEEVTADPHIEKEIPVIGSFGLLGSGKGFPDIVDAVCEEFDKAHIRFNFPPAKYALYDPESVISDCKSRLKPGVTLEVTRDFMNKETLINWLGQNTLNVFLYTRNMPGLAATTDQAISSGRPLAISNNNTFRHILPYITSYPERTLKESIRNSIPEVKRMQHDWSRNEFVMTFDDMISDIDLKPTAEHSFAIPKRNGIYQYWSNNLFPYIVRTKKHTERWIFGHELNPTEVPKPKVLIISNTERQCGIHQFGLDIFYALQKSKRCKFSYYEYDYKNHIGVIAEMLRIRPDVVVYNQYMRKSPLVISSLCNLLHIPIAGIFHEINQAGVDSPPADTKWADAKIYPDPTLNIQHTSDSFTIGRIVPSYLKSETKPNDIPIIGSFGFGFRDKGFDKIVQKVVDEYDEAMIRFHIPDNTVSDPSGAIRESVLSKCLELTEGRPGITLAVNTHYVPKQELLDALASNSLNCFYYDDDKDMGISSVIDLALAVDVPIAISKSGMFRHITRPEILVKDNTFDDIIKFGTSYQESLRRKWGERRFVTGFEDIVFAIISKNKR
jgi:hypothetical protein